MDRNWSRLAILPNSYAPKTKNATFCEGTALFDIMLFIISSLYTDNKHWNIEFDETLLKDLINTYIGKGAKAATCKLRTTFLKTFFNVSDAKILDCRTDVNFLLTNVFFPSIYSGRMLNDECECEKKSELLPFLDFSSLKLQIVRIKCVCGVINSVPFERIKFNQVVFFGNTDNAEVNMSNIQKVIILNSTVYILCAIVECILPEDSDNPNHFIGHLLRCTRWYTYDHTQSALIPTKMAKKIIPNLYVYAVHNMVLSDSFLQSSSNDDSGMVHFRNFFTNKVDGATTYVKNSCGPDSVLQSLCCLYLDSKKFKELCVARKIEKENKLFDLFEKVGENNSDRAHIIRNEILTNCFKSSYDNEGLLTIDCESNIYNVITTIVRPVFPSVVTMTSCDGCGERKTRYQTIIDIDLKKLQKVKIGQLESCILPSLLEDEKRVCPKCAGSQTVNNHVSTVLFFDVQMLQLHDKTKIGIKSPISFDDIPKTIKLKKKKFALKSVIHYIKSYTEGGIGHYIAICHISGKWLIFDDMKLTATPFTSQKVLPHMLLYFEED